MQINEFYNTSQYTPARIENKNDTERRRFRLWKTLTEQSGVSADPENGTVSTSEEKWQSFVAKHGGVNPRSIQWLRAKPLGAVDDYKNVFFREMATGETISTPDDLLQEGTTINDVPHQWAGYPRLMVLASRRVDQIEVPGNLRYLNGRIHLFRTTFLASV